MLLLNANSLVKTVDSVNAVHFYDLPVDRIERDQVAEWIASRQGLPGAYGGTFAATESDLAQGITTFTGDKLTHASARHILGEEACRALRLLQSDSEEAAGALERATSNLLARLDTGASSPGFWCCSRCSVGMWRNLVVGGLDRQEERLEDGLAVLKEHEQEGGRWRRFPFYYTLSALIEMDLPAAIEALAFAAPACERALKRGPRGIETDRRRRIVLQRALGAV